jgi:hypothetical protein
MVDRMLTFGQDKFTLNFFLPDGSFGSLMTGGYTAADGSQANLLNGDFRLENGTTGNIYGEHPEHKPNTTILLMPTAYTSKGVGSAIPASILGSTTSTVATASTTTDPVIVSTRIVPASTVSGVVIEGYTETASVDPGSTVLPTTAVLNIDEDPQPTEKAPSGAAGQLGLTCLISVLLFITIVRL